jgi:hypothetical protein
MKAEDYAKALYQLGGKPAHLKGLKEALARRKQLKLLPRILSEYQKLELRAARLATQKKVKPEEERTRVLLELYRTLIATPSN